MDVFWHQTDNPTPGRFFFNMLKVLVTNENRGPGGAERYTADLCRGLAQRGHQVTLAARRGAWLLEQGLPNTHPLPFASELDPVSLLKLRQLVRRADVVHCQANRDLALCGLLGPRKLFKSEHTFLDPTRSGLLNRAYRRSHILAVSEALATQVRTEFSRVSVLYNGIDLASWENLPPTALRGRRWIGCIAHLYPGKGQDDLIEAFRQLDDPELGLLLAGQGPERPRLQALAEGLDVWFHDSLDDPRLALPGLAVAVVPSYRETFSLACLEALACGIPLVATRTGGIPEVVGDAAILVEPGRPDELAEALRRALRDPPEGGRERARLFTQERMLDQLEELYACAAS